MSSPHSPRKVVILGTGGTIAGVARGASGGYTAAVLGVDELLASMRRTSVTDRDLALVCEQVAQVDSKDMSFAIWTTLAQRVVHHLSDPEVCGLVITHGTDTLEETAYFLSAVLPQHLQMTHPVVLTCAMRPASAARPDGPQNLADAIAVARWPGAHGVMAVCAGQVHGAARIQKVHPHRLDAFSSGDAGPLATVRQGRVRQRGHWPEMPVHAASNAISKIASLSSWPRVEMVMNCAGADGWLVDRLVDTLPQTGPGALRGLVVAGTGNGTIHHQLEAALRKAARAGVAVVVSTRCCQGRVVAGPESEWRDEGRDEGRDEWQYLCDLSPVKARVALMIALMG